MAAMAVSGCQGQHLKLPRATMQMPMSQRPSATAQELREASHPSRGLGRSAGGAVVTAVTLLAVRAHHRSASTACRRRVARAAEKSDGKMVYMKSPAQSVAKFAKSGLKSMSVSEQIERLFTEEVTQDNFAPNCWYESPDYMVSSKKRVTEWWRAERPNRQLEKVCAGKGAGGCTWKQLDGRRGVSFIRFDRDGQVSFVREVAEIDDWAKVETNPMDATKPLTGIMSGITGFLNNFEQYLTVDDNAGQMWLPKNGLAQPRSRRADDVTQYLWEEAQMREDGVERCLKEYSENVVFEDLIYKEEKWPQSLEGLRQYFEDRADSAPEGLRWILDEVSDTGDACVAVWHCEAFGQKTPRGLSYYELDSEGKVSYVRTAYNLSF